MKLGVLVNKIEGSLEGDGELEISGIASLVDAKEGDLSFLANSKYESLLAGSKASAVIVGENWEGVSSCAVVRAEAPDKAMAMVSELLKPKCQPLIEEGIHAYAAVDGEARVDPRATIGPFCVVRPGAVIGPGTVLVSGCYVGSDAVIGSNCLLHANSIVRERVNMGDRVILHEGAVVGGEGFGNYLEDGEWRKIPHIGTVEIGDDAEIGVNSTIDRARFGKTLIGKGVKIDNLVMVAHNVHIGDHTVMAAQAGVAGSSTIGNHVAIGGQAGMAGHLEVGDEARVGAKAGVTKNVESGSYVTGYPALPHLQAAKNHANLMRFQKWKEKIKILEKRLSVLESGLTGESET